MNTYFKTLTFSLLFLNIQFATASQPTEQPLNILINYGPQSLAFDANKLKLTKCEHNIESSGLIATFIDKYNGTKIYISISKDSDVKTFGIEQNNELNQAIVYIEGKITHCYIGVFGAHHTRMPPEQKNQMIQTLRNYGINFPDCH